MSRDQMVAFLWRHEEFVRAITEHGVTPELEDEILYLIGTDLMGTSFSWPDTNAGPRDIARFLNDFIVATEKAGYIYLKQT